MPLDGLDKNFTTAILNALEERLLAAITIMNNSSMIKKLHFGLLVLLFLNLLLFEAFDFGLNNKLMFLVRVLVCATGILLFFLTIKTEAP